MHDSVQLFCSTIIRFEITTGGDTV